MSVREKAVASSKADTSPRRAGWAWCGVAFVVLFAVYAVLTFPGPGGTPEEITAFYADNSNLTKIGLASTLMAPASLLFVWFLGGLRAALASAERSPIRLSTVAYAGGLGFLILFVVQAAVGASVAGAIEYHSSYQFEPGHSSLFSSLGFWLTGYAATIAAAMPLASSFVARRTRIFPSWLVWAGFVVGALGVLSMPLFGMPALLLLVWIVAVSVLGITGRVHA